MNPTVHNILHSVAHIFYPKLCEGCNKPLLMQEYVLCIGCESCLSYTHYHVVKNNETTLRIAGRFPFSYATSLAYFNEETLLQHLLHRLKYKNRKNIGSYLGKLLGKAIHTSGWKPDVIVPVPLYKKKEQKRGYNQSQLIAEGIHEILQIPVLKNAVTRVRPTETQTDKSRLQRVENVKDAFKIIDKKDLEARHVLLIDDVLTTGATIEACADALLSVKNVKLSIATIGIAV